MHKVNFEHIITENKDKIYRICRVYATPPLQPQDLFQEVVYQIWKSLASFKKNSSIDTWIYRIALNVCMRSKLKLERIHHKTMRLEAIQFKMSDTVSIPGNEEKYKLLKQCIAALNESDTTIIILHLEELPYKQIAEVTGLSENNIAVKMKRIRKKLFECIKQKSV